jgi:hypothetical protein
MIGCSKGSKPWTSFFDPSLPGSFGSYGHSASDILPALTRSAMECDNLDLVVKSSSVTIVET